MDMIHLIYLLTILTLLLIIYSICRMHFQKQRRLRSTIQEVNEQLQSFFSQTSDAIDITNLNDELTYVNPSFERLFGWNRKELIGHKLPIIPKDLAEVAKRQKEFLLAGNTISHWEGEFLRSDGTTIDVNVSVSALRDARGAITGFAAITRDISELKQYEHKLERLAFHDHLTGVGNRRSFYQQLDLAMDDAHKNNQQFALWYLDCDHFKWVNDTMGHGIGNALLQQFTARIEALLLPSGTLFRLGGDEFAIILTGISAREDVSLLAEQVIAALHAPWDMDGKSFVTTCSIGISIFPVDGVDEQTLITNADNALYKSKADGRNRVSFYSDAGGKTRG